MRPGILRYLAILGPGWVVMMADVDAPSVITGIQSGVMFHGHLLLVVLLLTIPLFIVQNSASKISAVKGESLGKIVSHNFDHKWTLTIVVSMAFIDFAAYIGEFAGIGAAGLIFGVPVWISIIITLTIHTGLIFTGGYRSVEKILIAFSSLLFLFLLLDIFVHPPAVTLSDINPFVSSNSFFYLVAANIGAVIMPWMIYYQMSANVERGVTRKHIKSESRETLLGAIVSEILMMSIIIFSWAIPSSLFSSSNPVMSVAGSISGIIGSVGVILFGLALWASGMLALVVVSISLSYAISDGMKIKGSLNRKFSLKDPFYMFYVLEIIPAAFVALFFKNLVSVALGVMVFNVFAVSIPFVFIIKIVSSKKIMGSNRASKIEYASLIGSFFIIIMFGVLSFI